MADPAHAAPVGSAATPPSAPQRLCGPASATSASGRELQQRAVRTREKILIAAAQVFYADGYAAATIGNIAELAQVTKGALYFHYPAKAALAAAVVGEHQNAWEIILAHSDNWDLPALDKVGALADAVATYYVRSPIARAGVRLGIEHHPADTTRPPPFTNWITKMTTLVESGHRDGSITADIPAETAARAIVASFYGVQEVSERLHKRADLSERVTEWWSLMRPVLAGPAATS